MDWKRIKAGEEDGSFTEQRGEERKREMLADPHPYRKLVRAASDCEDSRVLCEARDIGRSHRVG